MARSRLGRGHRRSQDPSRGTRADRPGARHDGVHQEADAQRRQLPGRLARRVASRPPEGHLTRIARGGGPAGVAPRLDTSGAPVLGSKGMDASSFIELLPTLALAIALAACAGLRACLPIFLAGLLARLGWLELGPAFAFLKSDKALIVFGIATTLEFLGDKIPAVDHALDVIGTPLRPAAGALLASSVLGVSMDPLT